MSFTYIPITDEALAQEAREFPLLPNGEYRLKVTDSKSRTSANGNPMMDLVLVTLHEGKEYKVFDSLIGTSNMAWKTKHFCESANLFEEYSHQQFNEHMALNRYVYAQIVKVAARPNPNKPGEMYKARNEVKDYIVKNSNSGFAIPNKPAIKEAKDPLDEDLPF